MNKLKASRAKANLTQKQLAALSGLTKSAICNYEKGSRTPSLQQAYKITSVLKEHHVDCELGDVFPENGDVAHREAA